MNQDISICVLTENEMGWTEPFELDKVQILDNYYLSAQKSDIAFLKKMDTARLLAGFRTTAGIDTKGVRPYGGWEDSLLGGHCVGHYLTALAQAVKVTGDKELKEKSQTLIAGLEECQKKLGTGFLFGAKVEDKEDVEKQFDILEGKKKGETWVPWYNMHKVLAGLVDTYKYTGNETALLVAEKLGDWIYERVSKWDLKTNQKVLETEYGGMNDCLYELYSYSHNKHHLEAAQKFDEKALFLMAAKGEKNCLDGKHANTQIPKFIGAIKRYNVLKQLGEAKQEDEAYLADAEKFFEMVVKRHSFVTGGISVMEHFRKDYHLDEIRTQTNCESCCAHNMLKLAKELFKATRKKEYADYYETTLRNAIMGAVKTESGAASYFTPMATGYYKTFGEEEPEKNMFWCCTGSGMENFTKLGDSVYFRANDTLLVNQYVASKVTWEEKNLVLTQKSDVTKSEEISFVLNALHDKEISDVAIALRIPDWMHGEATIYVNGAEKMTAAGNSEYVLLERNWEDGDVIMAKYPMSVESVGLLDQDAVFAFRYGPTVLAAKLGKEKMGEATWAGIDLTAPLYKVVGNECRKDTIAYGEPKTTELLDNETLTIQEETSVNEFVSHIEHYLVRDTESETLSFHLKGTDADTTFENGLQFVPFNTLNDERYGIYWYFDTEKNNDKE
uniref:beta-L-arabinofuranosidase domain-containing protein n=1 Tax=Eubacterium sp. TaxID=142586 RepID=UPI003FF1096A